MAVEQQQLLLDKSTGKYYINLASSSNSEPVSYNLSPASAQYLLTNKLANLSEIEKIGSGAGSGGVIGLSEIGNKLKQYGQSFSPGYSTPYSRGEYDDFFSLQDVVDNVAPTPTPTAPTEFQTYFNEQKALGKTPEQIYASSPFLAGRAKGPTLLEAQAPQQFNLNFRSGLTDAQKNSITKMLKNRANEPLNETDARNLNFALGGSNWEQYVGKTSSELGLYGGGATGGTSGTEFSNLPPEITSSQEWQNATDQNKSLVAMIYKAQDAIKSGDQALIQDTQDAIKKAVAAADPYFKQKILLAQDQINRSVASLTGDYTSSLKSYEDKIKQLKEDLIFNKDQLTLSQQQEMSEQLRNYQNSLYNTQQQLAEAGLVFSSPRQTAESNLMAEQQGIAQSTQRKYAQAFREQELNQQRQTQALQQNISDLERKKQEGLTDISRTGEAAVGTANLPATGVNPLGGITGSIDYEKQGDITQLTSNYLNWANLLK